MTDFDQLRDAVRDARTAYDAAAEHSRATADAMEMPTWRYEGTVPQAMTDAWAEQSRTHDTLRAAEWRLREALWTDANAAYQEANATARKLWQAVAKLADGISTGIGGREHLYGQLDLEITRAKAAAAEARRTLTVVRGFEL